MAKFTRAADRIEAFALKTVAMVVGAVLATTPTVPRICWATSATGILELASASMLSVPVLTNMTSTYSSVGVTTAAIIDNGRFRLGFLISSALVAITSNPMSVTYTVPMVATLRPSRLD